MRKKEPIRVAQIMGKWLGGGVESVVMNYYRNIDHNKVQFDFICDSDSTNIPYEEIESLGGKIILIPPYQKVFAYQKELIRILKKNDYKIVHSHISTMSVFPLRAAKKAGVPIRIVHNHSMTSPKEFKRNILKNVLRPFSKIYATDYFACSELAGKWMYGKKAFLRGQVYILNNAINLEKFKFDEHVRTVKRKKLEIDDNTLVVGHIGRFVTVKNHFFLIDIFNEIHKKNKNSILVLVGQGPLLEQVKEKVKDLGLEKKVKFLGHRNDVNELYQIFDVFIMPSFYEGLPVVGVEAQANGLLCIFSDAMTKETKLLEQTTFLNLEESPLIWAEYATKKYKRSIAHNEIINKGFDIKKESIKLEKKYIDFYKL